MARQIPTVHKRQPAKKGFSNPFKSTGKKLGINNRSAQPKSAQRDKADKVAEEPGKNGSVDTDHKKIDKEGNQNDTAEKGNGAKDDAEIDREIKEMQASSLFMTYRKISVEGPRVSVDVDLSANIGLPIAQAIASDCKPCLYGDWVRDVGWESGHRDAKRRRVRNQWRKLTEDEKREVISHLAGKICPCRQCRHEDRKPRGSIKTEECKADKDVIEVEERKRLAAMRLKRFEKR